MQNSILAGAVLGIIGGFVGVFVMMRDHAFAVHGISEMSFAGAALALLLGYDVVTGSMVGSIVSALLIGILGVKKHDSNSVIGALMPFGLGLGILFLSLYQGRSANKFSLLTGQIVSVDADQLGNMIGGRHRYYYYSGAGMAAVELRFFRPRGRPRERGADACPVAGVYGGAGDCSGAVGAGGWFSFGASASDYSGSGGNAGDGFSAAHAASVSAVC